MKRILLLAISVFAFAFGASQTNTTIGYSYVRLDKASYQAIEVGTSVVAIAKKGFVRPYGGAEVSVPIFFDTSGSNQPEYSAKGTGYGVALQVPLIFGIDIGGFYIQAMAGYNISWLNDALKKIPSGAQIGAIKDAKTSTISHGYIYGAGIGFNFSSNFTIGVRYIRGSMNNKVDNNLDEGVIPKYKTNYEKFMALIGYKF
ncbi:hypothetical protein [Helicobacter sp. MIT 14-3879]|uniref:hypothetical protein n=1 Tax=Helicobacter sp. MIT 14-3879 TaxID=2040649 RepID=UPI000E1F9EA9|nr:hypothetical protein [Helicobacter sp. MIT 14-3879]RDU65599.1 hypothetical protein CQA44_01065 [Helicobacter sp. MIT 14-3879]